MSTKEIALGWLDKAKRFLTAAKRSLDESLYDMACFNSQQAADMALKAVLIMKSGYKPLTHSITELLEAISEIEEVPSDISDCSGIEEHYIQARYPNARVKEYSFDEAQDSVKCGEAIVRFAEGILEEG